MNPTFADDDVVGTTGFTKALLRRLKALSPDTRTLWVRFVAISADAELAAPMLPVFRKVRYCWWIATTVRWTHIGNTSPTCT